MRITVLECDWGDAERDDIKKLLENVASHIVRELRDPFDETIRVMNQPDQEGPKAFFRRPGEAAYEVNLTAKDRYWDKFAYQFAHEFCHVLSQYDRLRDNPNNWFHESICELASLFVLRQMVERWPSCPPYPHWADYAAKLDGYVNSTIAKHEKAAPSQLFGAWLSENEAALRNDCYLRDKNAVVALKLLPVFEQTPHGWNAVRRLPPHQGRIDSYIEAWKAEVEDDDRLFVARIGEALSDNA